MCWVGRATERCLDASSSVGGPPEPPPSGTPFSVRWQGPDTVCVGRSLTSVRLKKHMEKLCSRFSKQRSGKTICTRQQGTSQPAQPAGSSSSSSSRENDRHYEPLRVSRPATPAVSVRAGGQVSGHLRLLCRYQLLYKCTYVLSGRRYIRRVVLPVFCITWS